MRRRQVYAERYPAVVAAAESAVEEKAGDRCPKCGKAYKNVGAHKRFCKA